MSSAQLEPRSGTEASTRTAFLGEDAGEPAESLPVTEAVPGRTFSVPWFKTLSRPAIAVKLF